MGEYGDAMVKACAKQDIEAEDALSKYQKTIDLQSVSYNITQQVSSFSFPIFNSNIVAEIMLIKSFCSASFCFIVSACSSNYETFATEQEINQPISTISSIPSNNPNVELKVTNEPEVKLGNTTINSSIEEQQINKVETQKQVYGLRAREVKEYVKELDNELKPYKSDSNKLHALERAKQHLYNAKQAYKLSIHEYFERQMAIDIKTCEIKVEAVNREIEALGGVRGDTKKSCQFEEESDKPQSVWGLH